MCVSVINWCLHKKFELVELEPTGDLECDTEGNKYGIERIIEALHAHMWPNIVLKGNRSNFCYLSKDYIQLFPHEYGLNYVLLQTSRVQGKHWK